MAIADAPLKISIVSDYIDKGAKAAQKSLTQVDYAAHKLAKTMGVALSGAAFVYFLKQSTAAAIADTKAQRALANQVANVGLSMQAADVEQYVQNLQYTSGVLDDQLRPALSSFITLTGSFADSQKLLQIALDASAGSGKSLAETVKIISQAYVGNMKGIKQLNLGLTQAELKGKSFAQILSLIQQKYSGSQKAQITAIDMLNVAMADLKEKVGTDFLAGLGIDKANYEAEKFKSTIDGVAFIVGGIAKLFGTIAGLAAQTVQLFKDINPFNSNNWKNWTMKDWGKTHNVVQASGLGNYSMTVENAKNLQLQKAQIKAADRLKKIEQDRLATIKKQNAAAAQKLVLDKAQAILNQAQRLFDLDQIELAAAMAKATTAEDKARLQVKKDIYDLEAAINDNNLAYASKIADTLVTDAMKLAILRQDVSTFANGIPDPFQEWLKTIITMQQEFAKLAEQIKLASWLNSPQYNPLWNMSPTFGTSTNDTYGGIIPDYVQPGTYGYVGGQLQYVPSSAGGGVNIQINPAVSGLIDVIQNQSASGISPTVNRINTSYIA